MRILVQRYNWAIFLRITVNDDRYRAMMNEFGNWEILPAIDLHKMPILPKKKKKKKIILPDEAHFDPGGYLNK